MKKEVTTLVSLVLGLIDGKLVDDWQDIDLNEVNTWNLACLEEILDESEGGQFSIRDLLDLEEHVAAVLYYFVDPLSMFEMVGTC